jgi:hypothetical protein
MRRSWVVGLVVGGLWAGSVAADSGTAAPPATPAKTAVSGPTSAAGQSDAHRGHHSTPAPHRHGGYWSDSWWPVCPPPYWYYYPPPLYLPAETLYGPQAVKRFMGLQDAPSGSASSVAAVVSSTTVTPGRAGEEKKPPVPRAANAETRGLAWRFVTFGDIHFTNERFAEAYQRYRKATEIVPELADAHFRQGFALLGSGRYEMAAKAIKRGLALDPGWPRSAFRLNELYNANLRAKAAHLEALARASEQEPNNADLLFLLGVCLFFDGHRDRSAPFFERVAQLAGPADYLRGFLAQAPPDKP